MKKAAVHNPYWDSMGGGEKYTATFIRLLMDEGWEVEVWWKEDISTKIKERFDIDIAGASFTKPKSSADYDLMFWVSDGSLPTSQAKKTFIHFQFPFANVGGKQVKNLIKSRVYIFVVNSLFTKKFIDKEFMVNSQVVYPPIDVDSYTSAKKTKRILYVGRFSQLTQQKGQLYLVEAFTKLEQRLKGWQLMLVGNTDVGTKPEDLTTLAQVAAGHRIEIVTNPSRPKLLELYAQTKIFWSASGYEIDEDKEPLKVEHFGITVVEGMAAGCVPVVTALGGHKEIVVEGENGYLWQSLNEMVDKTVHLVNDYQLWKRLSQAAIISSWRFSTEKFRVKFKQLL